MGVEWRGWEIERPGEFTRAETKESEEKRCQGNREKEKERRGGWHGSGREQEIRGD